MYCESMSYSLNPTDSSSCRETSWSVLAGLADLVVSAQGNTVDVPAWELDDAMEVFEQEGGRTEEQLARARTGTRAAPTASNAYVRKVMHRRVTGSSSRRMHQGGPKYTGRAQLKSQRSVNARCGQVGRTADNQRISRPETCVGQRRDSDKQAGDNGVDGIRNEAENRDYKTEQVVGSIGEPKRGPTCVLGCL
ncbi:hypothetical protein B0H14DRAFT_2632283 [Mycena olivaceomarginata]|nr:hypothetical protein B0H14DRAFT_2632283 [Mycena olivaceomarginata]